MNKSFLLLLVMFLGICIPQASIFSYLISYGLLLILFIAFLGEKLEKKVFADRRLGILLLFNILIAFFVYFLVQGFDKDLAFILFLVGITPTATAAPGVISILGGRVSFVMGSVLITNIFMAFTWPFFFEFLGVYEIDVLPILLSTLQIIFIPLISAWLLHHFYPSFKNILYTKIKKVGFYIWLFVIFLAISRASSFILDNDSIRFFDICFVFVGSGILCIFNFFVGKYIGGKDYGLECAQSLGQKNTIFSTWLALEFFNPFIALGPISYIFFHNLYNAYLLHKKK